MEIPDDLKERLGPKEEVQLYVKEKVFHPAMDIDSVAITNEKVILRHPHSLGLVDDYSELSYQDIAEVFLDKGLTRSTVRFRLKLGGDTMELRDLSNADAETAYDIILGNLNKSQASP
ncbi:MAG TPA: PH domain-containing protein [Conexivisphaerales archaeon]|nr:PH domain-containing protein [Conexivisphaerales archaeon]